MVKKQKVFIIGGRSGSTLMHKLLYITGEFRNWHDHHIKYNQKRFSYEEIMLEKDIHLPDYIRNKILEQHPNVNISFLKPMERYDLAKSFLFGYIVSLIIKKFKNPKFLILERNMKDIINSVKSINYDEDYPLHIWRSLVKQREKQINGYDEKNILRIEFNNLCNDFNNVMLKTSEFLGIKSRLKLWNKLKDYKVIETKRDDLIEETESFYFRG